MSGSMDIAAALLVCGYFGLTPLGLLQGIAAGVLGVRAFEDGWATALLGHILHFVIALVATGVYVVASARVPVLVGNAILCGAL